MPYITIPIEPKQQQLSFEDIMYGLSKPLIPAKDTYDTRTVYREFTPRKLYENTNVNELIMSLETFNDLYKDLIDTPDKSSLYTSFNIPKKKGGYRRIDKPCDRLSLALKTLKLLFERKFYANYHTSAFAYIKHRCPKFAIERHQANQSKWFLKTDLHNFFGSTTLEFSMSMLKMIFPFNLVIEIPSGKTALERALSLAFLNGGLPQGTPFSPMFTNIVMTPIDHAISKICREHKPYICYTRYADDMVFSAVSDFEKRSTIIKIRELGGLYDKTNNVNTLNKIKELIEQTNFLKDIVAILKRAGAPYEMSYKKTLFVNSNGSNWILGAMLNKDNRITLGQDKRNSLKVDIYNFMKDFSNGRTWSAQETMELSGRIAYHLSIEQSDTNKILKKYSDKFGRSVKSTIKSVLSN